jgi:CheY-like chemotaxis protein
MDLSMPLMGGKQSTLLIRQYEEEHGLERIPIVALTAHAMLGDREKCIEVGWVFIHSVPLDLLLTSLGPPSGWVRRAVAVLRGSADGLTSALFEQMTT